MYWSLLRAYLHKYPCASKNAAGKPQGNTKTRCRHPGNAYHMAASGKRGLNPTQDLARLLLLAAHGDGVPRDKHRDNRDDTDKEDGHAGDKMLFHRLSDVRNEHFTADFE